jgi:hypothetical protein
VPAVADSGQLQRQLAEPLRRGGKDGVRHDGADERRPRLAVQHRGQPERSRRGVSSGRSSPGSDAVRRERLADQGRPTSGPM